MCCCQPPAVLLVIACNVLLAIGSRTVDGVDNWREPVSDKRLLLARVTLAVRASAVSVALTTVTAPSDGGPGPWV